MTQQLIQQLVDFLKTSSPVVWSALVKQVYINAGTYLIWSALLIIIITILLVLAGKWKGETEGGDWKDIGYFLAYGGAIILGIFLPFTLSEGIRMLLNPNYYALMNIINILTGR